MKSAEITELRILRHARVGEPTTLTRRRMAVLKTMIDRKLVEWMGERRSGTLLKLTEAGEHRLAVLTQLHPEVEDYAARAAVRRATER